VTSGPFLTAVLSTASGRAFVGDLNRYVRAHDVKTGEVVWEARLGTALTSFDALPMTPPFRGLRRRTHVDCRRRYQIRRRW